MVTAMEKGNALEAAVSAIERAILGSSPALRENNFTIECKKRIVVDRVPHEIDVYVEVDMGNCYKAIFIFECKNRVDAVDKNDMIIFSKKIDDAHAQKGFFVAKSFTAGAYAAAKRDPRVELLIATELSPNDTPAPFFFHCIFCDRAKMVVNVEFVAQRGDNAAGAISFEIKDIRLNGQHIDVQKYVDEWANQLSEKAENNFASALAPDAVYEQTAEDERIFSTGELVVNGHEIEKVRLKIKFPIHVIHPAILSCFDVATRGRSVSFAPVRFGEIATLQSNFIMR